MRARGGRAPVVARVVESGAKCPALYQLPNLAKFAIMRAVRIGELRNHLSRYLRVVRGGAHLVVMDRDTPVAELGPITSAGRQRWTDGAPHPKRVLVAAPRPSPTLKELGPPVRCRGDAPAALRADREAADERAVLNGSALCPGGATAALLGFVSPRLPAARTHAGDRHHLPASGAVEAHAPQCSAALCDPSMRSSPVPPCAWPAAAGPPAGDRLLRSEAGRGRGGRGLLVGRL
jgi:antitoxin (DNA-binding transcriptional repressor) of toxin-antitoxin stability system